jgi:uncharacterized protein (TIGR02246 family)
MKAFFISVITLALFSPAGSAHSQVQTNNIEEIKQIERAFQEAWNRHDMKSLAALVAEDVDFVTVSGTWLRGRRDFEESHSRAHAMMFKESVLTTTDVQVKVLKPDIALVHVSWGMKGDKDPDGTPRQPRRGILTEVVTKHDSRWLIQASQNTNIREPQLAK